MIGVHPTYTPEGAIRLTGVYFTPRKQRLWDNAGEYRKSPIAIEVHMAIIRAKAILANGDIEKVG